MKQLIAGVVIIFVLGIGAFLYRNTLERPQPSSEVPMACTMEARICPDGSSVGRTGPQCEFAACPSPNIEVADVGIAFVLPAGYTADENAYGADSSLVAAFTKPSASGNPPHSITIRSYPIPAGKTADAVILERTRYQPADMQATDFSRFSTRVAGSHSFRSTVIERFEAQVHSAYYLPREKDVLVFEILERDVTDWTNASLVIESLPEHQALLALLGSLQTR